MRKIINSKAYDTTTAKIMAVRARGYYTTILYKKKNGEFFFICARFEEKTDDKGEKIYEPCGDDVEFETEYSYGGCFYEKVNNWVEKHFNEEYEKILGKVEE